MTNPTRTASASTATRWRKSSYSGGNNECIEVADGVPGLVPVRDSKRPTGPVIDFDRDAWAAFVDHLS